MLNATDNLDYVKHFQTLAQVHLAMRRQGPTAARLLQRAYLEVEMGNFDAGLQSARDAVALDSSCGEAHFQIARTYVFMALAKAGAMPLGPALQTSVRGPTATLLEEAVIAFRAAVAINPEDAEAQRDLEAVQGILDCCNDERTLLQALRSKISVADEVMGDSAAKSDE